MESVDGNTETVVRDTLGALLVYHVRCSAFDSYVLLCLLSILFSSFSSHVCVDRVFPVYESLLHCPFIFSLILTLLYLVSLMFDLVLSYHSC